MQLLGMEHFEAAFLLVILGSYLIIQPYFDKRQLFGKADDLPGSVLRAKVWSGLSPLARCKFGSGALPNHVESPGAEAQVLRGLEGTQDRHL